MAIRRNQAAFEPPNGFDSHRDLRPHRRNRGSASELIQSKPRSRSRGSVDISHSARPADPRTKPCAARIQATLETRRASQSASLRSPPHLCDSRPPSRRLREARFRATRPSEHRIYARDVWTSARRDARGSGPKAFRSHLWSRNGFGKRKEAHRRRDGRAVRETRMSQAGATE